MPEQLTKMIQTVKTKWDALEKQQKIRLVAAVLVVLVALVVTVYFTTRTNYKETYNNLTSLQAREIKSALDDAGIKSRISNNATSVEVDEKQLDNAKIEIETSNILSTASFTYADALNASGMSTTETFKRENIRRAKENDLSQAVKGFDGVLDAKVQLTIPDQVRFIVSNQDKSTAAVFVTTSRELTRNEGIQIARFICRSVEGLEMENVEVTDSQFNVLYSGMQDTSGTGFGNAAEMQEQELKLLKTDLRNIFMTMFNDVQVAPNLVYDNNLAVEQRDYIISPPVAGSDTGVATQEHTESRNVKGSPSANEPGLGSNDQASQTYETENGTTYSAQEKANDVYRDYNRTETVTSSGPGSYLRSTSSITVTLNRYIPHYQEYLIQKDKNFSDADWQDYKLNTQKRAVTDDPDMSQYVNIIVNATGIDANRVTVVVWEVPVFYDYTKAPIEIQQIIMFAVLALLILMLAYGLIRRTRPDEEEEIEPELSVEDLLVSTQLEEAKDENERLEEIDYFKDSEIKKQIEKFVNEKPDAVASLLRNWLNNEEW